MGDKELDALFEDFRITTRIPHNQSTEMRILRLQSELAAERAARRVAEARLQALQAAAVEDGANELLRSLSTQIKDFLATHGPRPYEFKVNL